MFGLGKKRTLLGKFIDSHAQLSQEWLMHQTGLNRDSVSDLCDEEKGITPRVATRQKIISVFRRAGYDVKAEDFWS